MHHSFHPKYPLKFHQNHHWMSCCPPWVPQPPPSFFNLLLMAWTCWRQSLHSWFTWLLFQEGVNRHPFQPKFEAHQPPIHLSPHQDQGSFITQTTQRPYKTFTLHCPQSNIKALATCTSSQPTSFTEQNSSPIIFHHILFKEDQQTVNPNHDSPNGYPTVTPTELQPVTLAH